MKYVIVATKDWADECDVHFFDILSEEDYKKYDFLKQTIGNLYDSYYFGTNEGWDDDFDYLQFKPKPATDEEIAVLEKFKITGESIIDRLGDTLENVFDWEGVPCPVDLWNMEYSEFCQIINDNKDLFE